jgi:hypothetical protein
MADNMIYQDLEHQRRAVYVGSNVAPGTPLLDAGRPAVTITGSGDHVITREIDFGGGRKTTVTVPGGGVGLLPTQATVTYTGTFAFDVVGATLAAAYEADGSGKTVYITAAGTLTLTEADNTPFGVVDFFRGELSPTDTAVKIGVTL